ncbi:MAG: glycoside hydrolase family 2 [Prevotellaceae bacterium]|nr:glycoside hydrolase family 2 [Prevotellaceae bacterium]
MYSYKRKQWLYLIIIVVVGGMMFNTPLNGQTLTHLWTGLQSKQPEATMPKGKSQFRIPLRKAKQNIATELVPVHQGEWIIASGWELGTNTQVLENPRSMFGDDFNSGEWLNATVPGTVLTTLVEQGLYPEPLLGLNNLLIPDTLCRMDWWYRNVFECPPQSEGEQTRLLFNGINYRAEVFLNGTKLGNIEGAFMRGEFDVSSLVRPKGKNILAVHIIPPPNPGIPHEQSISAGQGLNGGALSIDGPTFIAAMGWDWIPGIRDRNIGIWQDVRLQMGGAVKIIDPQIITYLNLPDTAKAEITVNLQLLNTSGSAVTGTIHAKIEGKTLEMPYSLQANESKRLSFAPAQYPLLVIDNPRLWWPNGYGRQELYSLELQANANNRFSDLKNVRFGIRELSYELMVNAAAAGNVRIACTPQRAITNGKPLFDYEQRVAYAPDVQLPTLYPDRRIDDFEKLDPADPMGPFLVIRVNGVRIFCRGGNWGMDEALKRSSRKRLEPCMKLHQAMNFNLVRNWTGESTEEVFYDLCDEYGMLVWNDFWITTDDTVEPNDQPLFLRNATDVVRRFRNHPSIAVWCPRNEGFAPQGLAKPLTEMLAREDPTRHYHGQSCKLNMPSSGPWEYFEDPSLYFTRQARGFNSEMGTYAIPTAATIRKFIAPDDLWPISDAWAYHDLHHTTQNFKGFMATVGRYGEASSMDDFARKAQFVTYDAWRSMLEAWNSRMWNNTSGLILWMSHPAWYSMIWQTYTYDYETPGSYFGSKKACEPLHIQMNLPDKAVAIINTTRSDHRKLTASIRCYDPSGKELERQTKTLDAPANSTVAAGISPSCNKPELCLVRLELKNSGGVTVSVNDYWQANAQQAYQQLASLNDNADLQIVKRIKDNTVVVEIKNRSKNIAAAIKLNAVDVSTGENILPAYFSDGYFNLLPDEKRIVTVAFDDPQMLQNCKIIPETTRKPEVKIPDIRKNKLRMNSK